jgi:hypothetical protein
MASSAGLHAQTSWRRMSGGKSEQGWGSCYQTGER